MNCKKVSDYIIQWLKNQLADSKQKGFVIGISGGIDSAVTSTLAAKTNFPVIVLNLPIHQQSIQYLRAVEHANWLLKNFNNVSSFTIELTGSFAEIVRALPESAKAEIALVNLRSRLRMLTLYAFANSYNYLVCGTGNKIEDFGVGFFTKYGDGGVDISPIGDLLKSEVYELGKYLGIVHSILSAVPSDGLWETDKSDEEQIGATYPELEWVMKFVGKNILSLNDVAKFQNLSPRKKEVLKIYITRHNSSLHKLNMPPICDLSAFRKSCK